jgi:NAD(P)-dependent dehydrogenase (short-subunit alcohol dehydrogenase family)
MSSRTILITGATGKLGKTLVRHFLESGDTVIACGRSMDRLDKLKETFLPWAQNLHLIEIDLISDNLAQLLTSSLSERGLYPEFLINNARNLDFLQLDGNGNASSENFINEFKLGVIKPYELVMGLVSMCSSNLRAVVNVGSIYGSVAPNLGLYADPLHQSPIQYGVTKAALAHLTKELAVRLASRNIRVNCVAFGGVDGRVDDAFKQRYSALCPAGRMLCEDEIAGPIDLLLSDCGSGINGHIMMVDGGWSIW